MVKGANGTFGSGTSGWFHPAFQKVISASVNLHFHLAFRFRFIVPLRRRPTSESLSHDRKSWWGRKGVKRSAKKCEWAVNRWSATQTGVIAMLTRIVLLAAATAVVFSAASPTLAAPREHRAQAREQRAQPFQYRIPEPSYFKHATGDMHTSGQ